MADKPIDFAKYLHTTLQKGAENKVDTIRWMCKQFDEFLTHNKAIIAESSQSTPRISLASLSSQSGSNQQTMRFRCKDAQIDRRQHRRFDGLNQIIFQVPPGETHTAVSTVSLADVTLAGVRGTSEKLVVDFLIENCELRLSPSGEPADGFQGLGIGLVASAEKRINELRLHSDGVAWFSNNTFTSVLDRNTTAVPHSAPLGPSCFTAGSQLSLQIERLEGARRFLLTLRDPSLEIEDSREIEPPAGVRLDQCLVSVAAFGVEAVVLAGVRPDAFSGPALPLSPTSSEATAPSTVERAATTEYIIGGEEFALLGQGATQSAVVERVTAEALVSVECESESEGANAVLCDPAPMPGFEYMLFNLRSFRFGVAVGDRHHAESRRLLQAKKLSEVALAVSVVQLDNNQAPILNPQTGSPHTGASSGGATPEGWGLLVETRLSAQFSIPRRVIPFDAPDMPTISGSEKVAIRIGLDANGRDFVVLELLEVDTMRRCLATMPLTLATATTRIGGASGSELHFVCGCIGGGSLSAKRYGATPAVQ